MTTKEAAEARRRCLRDARDTATPEAKVIARAAREAWEAFTEMTA